MLDPAPTTCSEALSHSHLTHQYCSLQNLNKLHVRCEQKVLWGWCESAVPLWIHCRLQSHNDTWVGSTLGNWLWASYLYVQANPFEIKLVFSQVYGFRVHEYFTHEMNNCTNRVTKIHLAGVLKCTDWFMCSRKRRVSVLYAKRQKFSKGKSRTLREWASENLYFGYNILKITRF